MKGSSTYGVSDASSNLHTATRAREAQRGAQRVERSGHTDVGRQQLLLCSDGSGPFLLRRAGARVLGDDLPREARLLHKDKVARIVLVVGVAVLDD
eukprot:6316208-Prymnesium_polylepis.1